jgi:4-amino-4-deoxy-L-arabinose transferase-like glycosyltransferase
MPKSLYIGFWIALGLVYLCGAIFIDVMDVDAAQYASIAREMQDSDNWTVVKHKHADYLDKPPLLFWLSALFYKIFGINHFAYRLPSLLATALGLFAVYKLGSKLYDKKTGELAALITGSCQAWILFNQDIRTDTMLSAFIIVAIWQLMEYMDNKKVLNFVFGFAAIGLAMLAKGPIGAVIPAFALSAYWLGKKEWKNFFRPEWLLGILITLLVLSPMIYGLWLQFGSEGLYFFFWKQSFGRITGENSWSNESGPLFFTHTFLWSFLPWSLLAVWAYGKRLLRFWNKGPDMELLTVFGFLLPFIALSFSRYKLPHYIFPLYPLMAIITAKELLSIVSDRSKIVYKAFLGIHLFLNIVIFTAAILLAAIVFPSNSPILWLLILAGISAFVFYQFSKKLAESRLLGSTLIALITLNLLMNIHFYPQLMQFQSGSQTAHFINKNKIPTLEVAVFGLHPNSLDFYIKDIAQVFTSPAELIRVVSAQPLWVYTNAEGKKLLEQSGAIIEKSYEFDHFHISKLSLKFVNPKTRTQVAQKAYLIRISGVMG